ncbi:hypothetical protein [Mycoplasmopsis synoviae]|uniref:hypothetical protein n=1 Tax=Mycoplasmopsis synoviae TaxID=2109 RepID=UPI001CB7938A|nr:hypothetical protein [Mycoplasmopsis synoviae]
MQFTSGLVTAAKTLQAEEQYTNVSQDLRTDLYAKLTAATDFLTEDSKLANLDASSNLDTTKATLESAKTALDAAVAAVKPDLDFQKTKTSAAAKVTELESLVNTALKAELQRQVNELTKEQAAQATTMLENLTSLKDSLTSLQDLVSKGLVMQVDYPRNYYDADNKADFDAALLKASSVFPAFQWTAQSIMVPTPEGDALPNPRAWTKARDKSEFKLQNFVMAPTQAATPTTTQTSPSAATSATVRVANGEAASAAGAASREAQTTPAPAPMADLASTASYLKSLNDTLKAATDALNGDNPTEKTAYYKPVDGRTLYWDGFMPKIVVQDYQADGYDVADGQGNNRTAQEKANKTKLEAWFREESNWTGLEDQLTKKLGEEKFKNMTLSNPTISWDEVRFSNRGSNKGYLTPKVTFNLAAKDGYTLAEESAATVTLTIRVLYKDSNLTRNVLSTQGAYYTATPSDNATTIEKVNVYLNYTGPSIVLDQAVPAVGTANNTSLNGTSNVTDKDFNDKFKKLLVSVLRRGHAESSLFQAVINYVNKFDPKFRAAFVTNGTNGVTITKVEKTKELRPGTLDDLVKNRNNVFLQQIQGDTKAVYLPVTAIASNNWLNTVLVRIPLTKFVRPISVLEAPQQEETQEDGEEMQQGNQDGTQAGQTDETAGSGTPQASSPQTMPNSSQ